MVNARLRDRAFVLIDAMVALMLLTGVCLVYATFYFREAREVRNTHERLAAGLLAEGEIERLRALPFHEISAGKERELTLKAPAARKLKGVGGTLSVSEVGDGLKRATVRIVWSSPRGRPNHVEMTGLFSRGETAR
jgi:hypothetical protein